jgi:hypothetical protein
MNSWSRWRPPKVQAVTFLWQLDHLVEHNLEGVTPHCAATVECRPDAALLVNGQAIGMAVLCGDFCERTSPVNPSFWSQSKT